MVCVIMLCLANNPSTFPGKYYWKIPEGDISFICAIPADTITPSGIHKPRIF